MGTTTTATTKLRNNGLPKWPQHVVFGLPITPHQALEVIRRTDRFFDDCLGHDPVWAAGIMRQIGFPVMDHDKDLKEKMAIYDAQRVWRETWGILDLEYIRTDWISSSFIFGNNGWCSPDGQICNFHNIGKYPSVADIESEWALIAETFPFLVLDATLWSGEKCEEDTYPIVGFKVRTGTVMLVSGDDPSLYREEIGLHGVNQGPFGARNLIASETQTDLDEAIKSIREGSQALPTLSPLAIEVWREKAQELGLLPRGVGASG